MITLLIFGFLIGMRHALDADHVAAVATLATRSQSLREGVRLGAIWGVGHTLTLMLIGSVVLVMDAVISERLAGALELAVGVMLVGLGADVLRRAYRDRVHFHIHEHADGRQHFHAHSHVDDRAPHDATRHEHSHASVPFRALFVGVMHGMAGSAALVLLSLSEAPNVASGILYILLFGFGSILGMAALSFAISIPLRYTARNLTWLHQGLVLVVGVATVALGAILIFERGLAG